MEGSIKVAAIINKTGAEFAGEAAKMLGFLLGCGISREDIRIISFDAVLRPETMAGYVCENISDVELYLTSGDKAGEELAVRIGSKLGGSTLTGARDLCVKGEALEASRTVYAGHVIARYSLEGKPFAVSMDPSITLRQSADDKERMAALAEELTEIVSVDEKKLDGFVEIPLESSSDLEDADCVVIAGRGAGNEDNVRAIAGMAETLGMPTAGTRPCVMNAWLPMSRLIGVSGRIISPRVAILLGVSGAPAFYEGIKGSQKIISINSDPDAPVNKLADLAVCGDCMKIFELFASGEAEKSNE